MNISFDEEAGEIFRQTVEFLSGYTATITVLDEFDGDKVPHTFDAELQGHDRKSDWLDAVSVRHVNDDAVPYGDSFTVRAETIHIL